jgi:hypothetical protein
MLCFYRIETQHGVLALCSASAVGMKHWSWSCGMMNGQRKCNYGLLRSCLYMLAATNLMARALKLGRPIDVGIVDAFNLFKWK